jgi:hypothetical protein
MAQADDRNLAEPEAAKRLGESRDEPRKKAVEVFFVTDRTQRITHGSVSVVEEGCQML